MSWDLRRAIVVVGIVGGVGDALLAIADSTVIVFFVGATLAYGRKVVGAAIVGFLSLVEVVFAPFYPRESTTDWIIQVSFAALGLVGLLASIGVVLERRRSRSHVTA